MPSTMVSPAPQLTPGPSSLENTVSHQINSSKAAYVMKSGERPILGGVKGLSKATCSSTYHQEYIAPQL